MNDMNDILKKINSQCTKRNWTDYRLCIEADLPPSTVSSWYHSNVVPSIPSLEKVCKSFGITLSQFFAEEDSLIELTGDLRGWCELYLLLSPVEKELAINFMRMVVNRDGSLLQTPEGSQTIQL